MTLREITDLLQALAPLQLAEDFDNVGLLTGEPEQEIQGILVAHDALESVVAEAEAKNCNLIVCFHPILFKGLKRLNGSTYVERALLRAIRSNIAIYALHTALDNVPEGVSGRLAAALGLQNSRVLLPKSATIEKLVTYVPAKNRQELLDALFEAGAGSIGKYSQCSFTVAGSGTFLPGEGANPTVGSPGSLQEEQEAQLHLTYPAYRRNQILQTLFRTHPYEEVAYEITGTLNTHQHQGMGMIGELHEPMEVEAFLAHLKTRLGTPCIRHSAPPAKRIRKVAVLGGSGAFAIQAAKSAGADALVTADLKYHDFFQGEGHLLLADVGHFESEQFTKNLLHEYLTEKIANFAIHLSEVNTNPVNYF